MKLCKIKQQQLPEILTFLSNNNGIHRPGIHFLFDKNMNFPVNCCLTLQIFIPLFVEVNSSTCLLLSCF